MSTRNIVDFFPADQLPDRLRGNIRSDHKVRVTVEDIGPADMPADRLRRLHGAFRNRNTSVDEAVSRIRGLRDEWGDSAD
jgi:hypothetical protein